MKIALSLLFSLTISMSIAQNGENVKLPYHQIPDYPADYGPGNVISRTIDGLGYRYYWATEGLRQQDLDYRPTAEARSAYETLLHLYGLSETIVNAPQNLPNIRPADWSLWSFDELRSRTLNNLKQASELFLGKTEKDIAEFQVTFKRGENENSFPYWNMLNGPLSDAIYHTGQIVSFRRSSGNPMNPKVNVFMGKNRE